MVMDTLGLALCVALTYSVRHQPNMRMLLPLLMFPVLVSIDLACIYRELKATHLSTLNRERAELLAERWLLDGRVFTAKQVSPYALSDDIRVLQLIKETHLLLHTKDLIDKKMS